ncbi:MAG: RNA 2',3'-cyclic phosphodiesterase [Chloroflexota bacterium]
MAVPIGHELQAELATSMGDWRRRPDLAGLRWSEPESWHLTLAFLGDVPAADLPRLTSALEAAGRGHEVGELRTSGLGGFPSTARARVAWCGVADPAGRLGALGDAVRDALALPRTEPFNAHVTLARARSAPVDLRPWLASARVLEVRVPVDRVELMRSHLGRGPARYEVLASVSLGVPAGV